MTIRKPYILKKNHYNTRPAISGFETLLAINQTIKLEQLLTILKMFEINFAACRENLFFSRQFITHFTPIKSITINYTKSKTKIQAFHIA